MASFIVSGPASPIHIFLEYISITCACASFSRGSGCTSGQPVAAAETSVATDDVLYDAGPCLTPVTFLSKGLVELRPPALVTILQVKA